MYKGERNAFFWQDIEDGKYFTGMGRNGWYAGRITGNILFDGKQ